MLRRHSSSALTFAFTAALLSTSSCSLKRNLDEMHDDTHNLGEATQAMKKTMEEMKKITEGMSSTTCVMYRSMRQGNAKVSRDQDLKDIKAANNISGRLAEASEYMQGFEYQIWSPTCVGDDTRDLALEQNARELLAKTLEYIKNRSAVGATKTSNNSEVLYSLAATLHYTNPLQAELLKGSDIEVLRPFDILVKGLELDQAKNRGELVNVNFPAWADVVGKYKKEAEFILRVRGNFLMAYAYAIADSDDFGNSPGKMEKIFRVLGTKLSSKKWKPNFDARTTTEIRERMTVAMNYAYETKTALMKLGIDPMTDKTILKIWKQADFEVLKLDEMDKSVSAEVRGKGKAIRELMVARDRLLTLQSSKN